MIEYKNFIYLDVYKTGSSHVVDLLKKIVPEEPVRMKRHSSLTNLRPLTWTGGKLVFSTVRNPWDWYVSLWAYGCAKKGAVYQNIADTLSRAETAALYNPEDPKASFRLWTEAVCDPDFLNRTIQQDLPDSGMARIVGFYTYRFMRVTTPFPSFLLKKWNIGAEQRPDRLHPAASRALRLCRECRADRDGKGGEAEEPQQARLRHLSGLLRPRSRRPRREARAVLSGALRLHVLTGLRRKVDFPGAFLFKPAIRDK